MQKSLLQFHTIFDIIKIFINKSLIMTVEEVKKNMLYKFATRTLRQEFPFIKDFEIKQSDLDKYSTIFLTAIIDAKEAMDTYGWKIFKWVLTSPEEHRPFTSIFDIDYDEYNDKIRTPTSGIIWDLQFNDDIPKEFKLEGRTMTIMDYKIIPIDISEINPEDIRFNF